MKIWLLVICIIYSTFAGIGLLYYVLISRKGRENLSDNFLKTIRKKPFVSIIIPTLNEEHNIVKCLKSLRHQEYPRYEIILVDGGSVDNTISKAEPFVDKIIVEKNLPKGWIGKNYGCHLGYLKSKGQILLFTDADTVHKPDSLRIMVSTLLEKKVGLLTAFPYQEMKKWWEGIVPIYFYLSHITSGGLEKVNDPKEHDSFVGVGQYLLFTRKAYNEIGGHLRIKGSIIEDYAFAKIAKSQLHSLYYTPSNGLITAQMYPDSFNHCWTGFKKVLYAGTKLTPPRRITITLIVILTILFSPAMIFLTAYFSNYIWLIAMCTIYLSYLFSFTFYWHTKGKHYWITYTLFPFLMLFFIFTLIASTLEIIISKKTKWKGRKYKPDLTAGMDTKTKNKNTNNSNPQMTKD